MVRFPLSRKERLRLNNLGKSHVEGMFTYKMAYSNKSHYHSNVVIVYTSYVVVLKLKLFQLFINVMVLYLYPNNEHTIFFVPYSSVHPIE